jgi:hypothetical protein
MLSEAEVVARRPSALRGTALDFAYLAQWAAELTLTDLLETALVDAGLEQEKGT